VIGYVIGGIYLAALLVYLAWLWPVYHPKPQKPMPARKGIKEVRW
jgi:hypothetical protein